MELKDVILSTLAEMEDTPPVRNQTTQISKSREVPVEEVIQEEIQTIDKESEKPAVPDSEMLYLTSIKERLLVLFEGFQAPNNTNIEAKVDMTLNFLEYTLATLDSRIQTLEKGNK